MYDEDGIEGSDVARVSPKRRFTGIGMVKVVMLS